jgi:hypothetical protein
MSKIIHISSIVPQGKADKLRNKAVKYKPSIPNMEYPPVLDLPNYNNESVVRTPREKAIIDHCDMVAKIIVGQIMSET